MTSEDKRAEAVAAQAAAEAISKASGGKVVSNGTPSPEPPPIPKPIRIPVRSPLANRPRGASPEGVAPRSSPVPSGTQERRDPLQVIPLRPPSGGGGGSGAGNGKNQSTNQSSGGSGMSRHIRFALIVIGMSVFGFLYFQLNLDMAGEEKIKTAKARDFSNSVKSRELDVEAKKLDLEIRRKAFEQAPVVVPQAAPSPSRVVQVPSETPVVISGPSNIGPGRTLVQLDFAVTNSNGYVAQVKAFDGRTCTNSDDCTKLMKDLTKDLSVDAVKRQVEVHVGSDGPYYIGVQ